MELFDTVTDVLEFISKPAFAVKNGEVCVLNEAARSCLIRTGMPVSDLLYTGSEEYAALADGCLYLVLHTEEHRYGASVTKFQDYDVFVLERNEEPELQALALASRELRGPLAHMMISARQLSDSLDPEDPNAMKYSAALNRGMRRMLRLIANMSDAYLYTTAPKFRLELRDMTAVVCETFEKAISLTDSTDIRLNFVNEAESVLSLVDTDRVERAIFNLVSNALKFSHPGDTVEARLTRRGDKLCLTVRDKGRGIPPKILHNVFTRYLREPCAEDGLYGLGLGMVLVRNCAAVHGGTVLLEYTGDVGTAVTMTLSIRAAADCELSTSRLRIDYAGEMDHGLLELSDVLPDSLYL